VSSNWQFGMNRRLRGITRIVSHACVLLLTALAVCGCGERGQKLVKAGGVVTYRGKPLPEASITFVPVDGGLPSIGRTDTSGQFELTTSGRPGAPIGSFQVAISAVRQKRPVSPGEAASMTTAQIEANHEQLIPLKYNNLITSGLTADVADDENANAFTFDLK
jgi:hypothetical protein